MAKLIKKSNKVVEKVVAKKVGRPAAATSDSAAKANKDNKPVVIFLPKKLHARVRLGCIALSTSISAIVREALEDWTKNKAKAIANVINMKDEPEVDEDEDEDTEVEENDEEEEDDSDDEEEEDEDEDEDDDE
jgi:hypothetical protein